MTEKYKKFLPIGTVVQLVGGTKPIMIMGYCPVAEKDKAKLYDYSAVLYPEGYLRPDQVCLFNHEQIEKIFCLGFSDENANKFREELLKLEPTIQERLNGLENNGGKDFLNN